MDSDSPVLNGMMDRYGELAAHVNYNDVAFGGLCFLSILAIGWFYRQWRKGRGYRMAVKDRNDKEHALLLEIITDGLLDAEIDGKISRQRHRALCKWVADKLGLRDLVPKQMMLEVVKQEIKARLRSTRPDLVAARRYQPTIPGEKPNQFPIAPKFAEVIGKFAKFKRAA